MKPRTKARSLALQALYEIDITGHPPGEVIEARFAESPMEEILCEFSDQ
ncbi:MAG: hypothetical protein MUC85_07740 [Anaerolineales bacterium]|nr:hypothetical protein [Anaerolineales bacterium]